MEESGWGGLFTYLLLWAQCSASNFWNQHEKPWELPLLYFRCLPPMLLIIPQIPVGYILPDGLPILGVRPECKGNTG